MSQQLVANMLVSLNVEDDYLLFDAAIRSIAPAVDGIVVLDNSPQNAKGAVEKNLRRYYSSQEAASNSAPFYSYEYNPEIIESQGFSAARNNLLARSPAESWIFWVDSDEVHFTEQLLDLRRKAIESDRWDDIRISFVHFVVHSDLYALIEPRICLFRRSVHTRWINPVHELVVHSSEQDAVAQRRLYWSSYTYHHYGYLRPQTYISDRLTQYALKIVGPEGDEYKQRSGYTVDQKNMVLQHRKEAAMPYCGPFPAAISRSWIDSKRSWSKK